MHRPDVAGGTPGTAPAGVTQHDPCRHLVMDSLTPSGWRSNRPCSGRSRAGERSGLLVPGGPTRALERCPWPTRTEGASGLRAAGRGYGLTPVVPDLSTAARGSPALQALALGRAETSACQRARFSQDSGTGTRAAMEAKSTAHKAVMSAMVNASPVTNRDWARSSFSRV